MNEILRTRLKRALFVGLVLGGPSCASTEPAAPPQRMSGSVVSSPPEATWGATRATFLRLSGGSAELNSLERTASMTWQGAEVWAGLALHTSGGTVLRLSAQRDGQPVPDIVQSILLDIQLGLNRRR